MADAAREPRRIEVTEKDLPLHCPQPSAPLWARHPRVFLDVTRTGSIRCPYCGNEFTYTGAPPKGH